MNMRHLIVLGALMVAPLAANADSWHTEGYHRHTKEYKHEYWDGNCKVKREYKRNGNYKEKRSCKRPDYKQYDRDYAHKGRSYKSNSPLIIIEPIIRIGSLW